MNNVHRRSLQWERGLKFFRTSKHELLVCRSLQWERGLKYKCRKRWKVGYGRSLQWERGLKYMNIFHLANMNVVVPCNGNVD